MVILLLRTSHDEKIECSSEWSVQKLIYIFRIVNIFILPTFFRSNETLLPADGDRELSKKDNWLL